MTTRTGAESLNSLKTLPFGASLLVAVLATLMVMVRDIDDDAMSHTVFLTAYWVAGLLAVAVFGTGLGRADRRFMGRTFVLAFSIRVFLLALIWILVIPYSSMPFMGGGDDVSFNLHGRLIADAWQEGNWGYRLTGQLAQFENGYNYVVAAIHYVGDPFGGTGLFGIALFNSFVGALIVLPGYRIARYVFSDVIARKSALLIALAPDLLLYSLVGLRDVLIALFIALFVLFLMAFLYGRRRVAGAGLAALIGVIVLPAFRDQLHAGMMLIAFVTFVVVAFASTGRSGRRGPRQWAFVALWIGAPVGLLLAGDTMVEALRIPLSGNGGLVRQIRETASIDSLGVGILELATVARTAIQTVRIGVLPFPPWAGILSEQDWLRALLTLEVLFWYPLIPFWLAGTLWAVRHETARAFPIYGVSTILILATALSAGVDIRWRLMAMPLMLITVSVGLEHRREYRWMRPVWWAVAFAAIVGFPFLKVLL